MPAATLVRSTLTGVRPLGVRGEPLHATHEQIRGVVRRRLGERHAWLLAEPQPGRCRPASTGNSETDGAVAPLSSCQPEARAATLAEVESLARDIEGLGARLAETSSDDARLLGRAPGAGCAALLRRLRVFPSAISPWWCVGDTKPRAPV